MTIAPQTALIDPNIHLRPFTAMTSADIAPCAPADVRNIILPGETSLLLCATGTTDLAGKLYPGVLFCPGAQGVAQPRPLLPNTGNVLLSYSFAMDAASLGNGNVLETDVIAVIEQKKYNLSLERHLASGQIDIGGWTNTTVLTGALAPDVAHHAEILYKLDTAAGTCAVPSYTCDGATRVLPAAPIQPMAATPCNWLDSVEGSDGAVYVQLQLGLMPSGAPVMVKIWDLCLRYW